MHAKTRASPGLSLYRVEFPILSRHRYYVHDARSKCAVLLGLIILVVSVDPPNLTHANAIINIVRDTASATHLRNLGPSVSDSINLTAISGKEMLKVGSSRSTIAFLFR